MQFICKLIKIIVPDAIFRVLVPSLLQGISSFNQEHEDMNIKIITTKRQNELKD
jgi:hypothetical protein